MILLSLSLDTLGLLVRVWLWLSVPIAVFILLVATWLNFRRNTRNVRLGLGSVRLEPGGSGFILAVEGWEGEGSGVRDVGGEGFVGSGDVVGHGEAVREAMREGGEEEGVGVAALDEGAVGVTSEVGWERGLGEDSEEFEAMAGTGKETIYRGILWMKEKYEQYREQTDRRYELLREELGRMLSVKQAIIDELEIQLRSERMKVEELVGKIHGLEGKVGEDAM